MKVRLEIIHVGIVLLFFTGCHSLNKNNAIQSNRFFSDSSFWNQPIPENPEIDPKSSEWISLLNQEPTKEYFGITCNKWTVPVYEVDSSTPVYLIKKVGLTDEEKSHWHTQRDSFGHGPGFLYVPLPDGVLADPEEDSHLALIDRKSQIAWDMWAFHKLKDGSFESNTGMRYSLDGPGVYNTESYNIIDGESVHFHGPGRASGVPIIAGLIMYDEVMSGEIRHKLSCASRYGAFQEFVFPASWTDGSIEGGIPEGALIQLDPKLSLDTFHLTREETIVARAMQKYGLILVDMAQGQPIYAEGLWGHPGKTWKGKLREWDGGINSIPYNCYRILKVTNPVHRGDARSKFKDMWSQLLHL